MKTLKAISELYTALVDNTLSKGSINIERVLDLDRMPFNEAVSV